MTGTATAQVRIELVLDSSRGMGAELEDGQTRIEAVRQAIGSWIAEQQQERMAGLGLHVVGGTAENADTEACSDVRVLIKPGETEPDAWLAALDTIQPTGSRALIQAVIGAAATLASEPEPAALIVITSGENECEVDGDDAAAALAGGIELRVIGIGLVDEAVERFAAVAPTRNTTGADSLLEALQSTVDEIVAERVVLEVPAEVAAGHPFEVIWDGPAGAADFLSVADPDSDGSAYLNLHLAERGSPATLVAPPTPGAWEVRYVDGRKGKILRRQVLEVGEPPIAITAPAVVSVGDRFEISWGGPDSPGDFIAVAETGSGPRQHLDWFFTSQGSPASLAAPMRSGAFEIRYISGGDHEVLAAVLITVEN